MIETSKLFHCVLQGQNNNISLGKNRNITKKKVGYAQLYWAKLLSPISPLPLETHPRETLYSFLLEPIVDLK